MDGKERGNMMDTHNTVTPQMINAKIDKEQYFKAGEKTTVCVLTLRNGFEIVGSSACVDPENFDLEVGQKWARKDAVDQVEKLEGYALQSILYMDQINQKRESR